jgi:putative transposase
MPDFLAFLLRLFTSPFRATVDLEIEVLALRQQLAIYQRSIPRPRLRLRDRLFWCWLSRLWSGWKDALVVVKPATVIAWRRRKFAQFWAKLSAKRGPGRPPVPQEIQNLIRQMSSANVCWGSPRIRSELKMLGIDVAKSTVEQYMVKRPKPASPTWRAFLANHVACLASIDFFTVPTLRNRVLYVCVLLAHLRRRVVHFAVTEHPTAAWTAQQVTEAFPWDTAPSHMIRDG